MRIFQAEQRIGVIITRYSKYHRECALTVLYSNLYKMCKISDESDGFE